MNTNVIMTLFQNLGNILNLTAGYFFMKSIDCCLKRRKSRVLFLIGLFGYGTVASINSLSPGYVEYFDHCSSVSGLKFCAV